MELPRAERHSRAVPLERSSTMTSTERMRRSGSGNMATGGAERPSRMPRATCAKSSPSGSASALSRSRV
jgi:hypothetical protein